MRERLGARGKRGIATLAVVLGSLGFPTIAHASDMGMILPMVWIPALGLWAIVCGLIALGFRSRLVARWVHILFYVAAGLVSLPSFFFAMMTLSYLEGRYMDIAWTYMGAFVITAVATGFAVRESVRARRRERAGPEGAGTPPPPTP